MICRQYDRENSEEDIIAARGNLKRDLYTQAYTFYILWLQHSFPTSEEEANLRQLKKSKKVKTVKELVPERLSLLRLQLLEFLIQNRLERTLIIGRSKVGRPDDPTESYWPPRATLLIGAPSQPEVDKKVLGLRKLGLMRDFLRPIEEYALAAQLPSALAHSQSLQVGYLGYICDKFPREPKTGVMNLLKPLGNPFLQEPMPGLEGSDGDEVEIDGDDEKYWGKVAAEVEAEEERGPDNEIDQEGMQRGAKKMLVETSD